MDRPRLLIEDWFPAAAIVVECIRERSTGQQPPDKRLHVWWARRPLAASRAAVLGSLLPADFPREVFERLLGFGRPGSELVEVSRLMDTGFRVPGGFNCDRAFKTRLREDDLAKAHAAAECVWGKDIMVIDPMAGGGSIPLESARLGFHTLANEYNPVACTVLEATVDYPFRFGADLGQKTRKWAKVWEERVEKRLGKFFPPYRFLKVHAYIYSRTVPCPDTHYHTPLVPDWHLLKPSGERGHVVAEPVVNKAKGTWSVRIMGDPLVLKHFVLPWLSGDPIVEAELGSGTRRVVISNCGWRIPNGMGEMKPGKWPKPCRAFSGSEALPGENLRRWLSP